MVEQEAAHPPLPGRLEQADRIAHVDMPGREHRVVLGDEIEDREPLVADLAVGDDVDGSQPDVLVYRELGRLEGCEVVRRGHGRHPHHPPTKPQRHIDRVLIRPTHR